MTQYRLLDNTVDVIEATDEFWDAAVREWKVVPRDFIGERFYAVIPYRRTIPDPEPVKQEHAIDPGEGYRLVEAHEIVLSTDQCIFTNNTGTGWGTATHGTFLHNYIKEGHTFAEIKNRTSWSCVVFRRRATQKIVLKEYLERYGTSMRIEWYSGTDEGFRRAGFLMPDESWPTGQEREIEVPV